MKKIRVLIVDDSAAMRQLLTTILNSDPGIEVVGVATDPFMARDKVKQFSPDVITLDVEMPKMDGLTFLEKLMRGRPTPVVMISSLTQRGCDTTMRALELGAVDFVPKPAIDTLDGVKHSAEEIIAKVKGASMARLNASKTTLGPVKKVSSVHSLNLTHKVIAIGASTGGTEAIREVLTALPAGSPGIVVVQHMPPGFTRSFADRLNSICEIRVKEAEDGDRILPGHALIAPGDFHTLVVRSGAYMSVKVVKTEAVNRHRPSVDVMFDSCAETLGPNVVAAILTGMGNDGAEGMRRMRVAGARTIAQDKDSCVVFGMPKEAIAAGGAEFVLPLDQIAERLITLAA